MKIPGLVALLVLALSFMGCKPSRPEHGLEFLLTATSPAGAPLNSNEFQRVVDVLVRRQARLDFPAWVERRGTNSISIKVDPDSKEQIEAMRTAFTRSGILEFRLGHAESEKLLADGLYPDGYMMLREKRLAPSMSDPRPQNPRPHLVSRKAVAGLVNRNLSRVAVAGDALNMPAIDFAFNPEGAAALAQATSGNVGRELAIVIDGQLYSAPLIRSPITEGRGRISGAFTKVEVITLVTILQEPLEAKVEILEERRF